MATVVMKEKDVLWAKLEVGQRVIMKGRDYHNVNALFKDLPVSSAYLSALRWLRTLFTMLTVANPRTIAMTQYRMSLAVEAVAGESSIVCLMVKSVKRTACRTPTSDTSIEIGINEAGFLNGGVCSPCPKEEIQARALIGRFSYSHNYCLGRLRFIRS